MASEAAPTPGRTTASARSTSAGLLVTWGVRPSFSKAFATLRRLPAP